MARVPTNPMHSLGVPDPASTAAEHVPENPATTDDGTSGIDYQAANVFASTEPTEDDMRAAAASLGLDFDRMGPDDREFVATFASGALASIPATADPDNPLIPGDPNDAAAPDPTAPTEDAAAPQTGAEGAGVGSAPDVPGGDGTESSDQAVASSPVVAPAGSPVYEIPSPLPPPLPDTPEPAPQQEPLVYLPNGNLVPLSVAQQVMAQQPVAPQQTGQLNQPPGVPTPFNPGPAQQFPTPFNTEYVDERAGSEIATLNQRLAFIQQQQEADAARARDAHMQGINQAIEESTNGYAAARALNHDQASKLLDNAARLGFLGSYGAMYPNDPRRAVGAALEAAFWLDPEFRQHEVARQIQTEREQIAEVERKKALASSTVSSTGSVSRTPPAGPPRNRAEADAGIAAMIEADPAYQSMQRR